MSSRGPKGKGKGNKGKEKVRRPRVDARNEGAGSQAPARSAASSSAVLRAYGNNESSAGEQPRRVSSSSSRPRRKSARGTGNDADADPFDHGVVNSEESSSEEYGISFATVAKTPAHVSRVIELQGETLVKLQSAALNELHKLQIETVALTRAAKLVGSDAAPSAPARSPATTTTSSSANVSGKKRRRK